MLILEKWCHNKSEMPVKQQEKASYRSQKGEELALESDSAPWLKLQLIKNCVPKVGFLPPKQFCSSASMSKKASRRLFNHKTDTHQKKKSNLFCLTVLFNTRVTSPGMELISMNSMEYLRGVTPDEQVLSLSHWGYTSPGKHPDLRLNHKTKP